MREPQKIKRLRLSLSDLRSSLPGKTPKADEFRLVLIERQSETIQSLVQVSQERLRIVFPLKAQHCIIGIADDDDIARRAAFAPLIGPEVQTVVEIDIRQQRRSHCALRHPTC